MLLRHLVMLVALAQAGLDSAGLLLTVGWPEMRSHLFRFSPDLAENSTRMEENYQEFSVGGAFFKDFSKESQYSHQYSRYVVPHIFSGVVARMLNGFPCITAEHMVEELLEEWREERRRVEKGETEQEVAYVIPLSEVGAEALVIEGAQDEEMGFEELDYMMDEDEGEDGDEEAVEVVEVEEILVTQWRQRVKEFTVIHRLANLTLDAEEELMQALALRDEECTMVLSTSTNHLEVAFLISNLAATLLLFLVSNMSNYPRLHLPWMVFSSVEIVGNFVVAIAFLLVPGPALLISCVCISKLFWLRWIWANLVRSQMNQQINSKHNLETSLSVQDLERQNLKRQYSERVGKIRLGRFLGRLPK